MTLGLHANCQVQLRAALAEQLANASVRHGMFLTPISSGHFFLAQTALPTTGKLHARMQKLIGEAPFVDFVSGTLARELYESQEYRIEDGPVPLASIPAYSDLDGVANRLVAAFDSLPWKYTVTTPLPHAFSEVFCSNIGKLQLSDSVAIACGNNAFSDMFPLQSGIAKRDEALAGGGLLNALLIGNQPAWKPDRAYLQVIVEGFVGKFQTTEPLQEAISLLRAFFGLGLALRLFKTSTSYQAYPQREKLYIHHQVDEAWIVEDTHELESHRSETIRDSKLHNLEGSLDTVGKQAAWMSRKLAEIGVVLRANERARNIVLGAQWLFDSHCGSDELLQFVQAAVVVEILLGDKAASDLTGLGELLSNRCAYLIATSHAQRIELLQDFRAIYDVRSKIVHRGKSRLALGERTLFYKLRWICRRVIQEEVELLEKDEAAGGA